jgi:hypothetical protein
VILIIVYRSFIINKQSFIWCENKEIIQVKLLRFSKEEGGVMSVRDQFLFHGAIAGLGLATCFAIEFPQFRAVVGSSALTFSLATLFYRAVQDQPHLVEKVALVGSIAFCALKMTGIALPLIATVGGIFCLSALTIANLGRMYHAYDKENQIDKKAREVLQSSGHQNVSWKHYHIVKNLAGIYKSDGTLWEIAEQRTFCISSSPYGDKKRIEGIIKSAFIVAPYDISLHPRDQINYAIRSFELPIQEQLTKMVAMLTSPDFTRDQTLEYRFLSLPGQPAITCTIQKAVGLRCGNTVTVKTTGELPENIATFLELTCNTLKTGYNLYYGEDGEWPDAYNEHLSQWYDSLSSYEAAIGPRDQSWEPAYLGQRDRFLRRLTTTNKTPNNILGLDGYNLEKAKREYRKLALVFHPDKCGDKPYAADARKLFDIFQAAYDYLEEHK